MLQAPRKVSRVCFDMMQRAAKRNGGIVKSSDRTHTTRRAIQRFAREPTKAATRIDTRKTEKAEYSIHTVDP